MKLDEKYRIVYDENNVVLQFFEQRVKEKKDGNKENYEFVDSFYFPNIKQALKSYANKTLKGSSSFLDLICRIELLESKIDNLELIKQ